MTTGHPRAAKDYNDASWEPLWAAAEETGLVVAFHIGTDGGDQASMFRGPGGAVLNYVQASAVASSSLSSVFASAFSASATLVRAVKCSHAD
jgi:predicted TIM-barrel fold metal-dependent hydrolase